MKLPLSKNLMVLFLLLTGAIFNTFSQEQSLGAMVSKKVGLYVFPAQEQSAEQQADDESYCYQWGVQQSGIDPLNPPQVQAQQVQTGPDGAAVGGAARGALAGVAIGAIAGDAGKGAAIGAASGAIAGRRRSRVGRSQQQQANNQAADQAEADMMNSFKKAYSACLQGKGYSVN
ncbi:glycine zipper family protein [uncultured Eudoraea sp.]|uniref:glycine zipper family protein n=1 Tax=uncultured Eudoraea sp. TaxID=1035614 RepID=UPI00262BF63E|nr:glycine zipper family protein [uncultured Eudoraea sp.]